MTWLMIEHLLGEPLFWVRVLVTCALWYAIACMLSISFMEGGEDPRQAARRGPWLALLAVLLITCVGSWIWWHDLHLTSLLSIITFLIPAAILTILTGMDSASEM